MEVGLFGHEEGTVGEAQTFASLVRALVKAEGKNASLIQAYDGIDQLRLQADQWTEFAQSAAPLLSQFPGSGDFGRAIAGLNEYVTKLRETAEAFEAALKADGFERPKHD